MKPKTAIISLAALVAGSYVLYEFGLRDDAKAKIEELAQGIKSGYQRISDVLNEMQGYVADDPGDLPNVKRTREQWEQLGY